MVESPTKVKRNAKSFLHVLLKHKVKLDSMGDPDFSDVTDPNIIAQLTPHESLIRITLMLQDMEFEYP